MKNKVLLWLIIAPLQLLAQTKSSGKGIQWLQGLSWPQILEKAKTERKLIFLDGPCRAIEKDVYSDEQVGEAINEHFISVKVQMDKTAYDNDTVKKWYSDASTIQTNYAVNAFPTFLFFSPDGQPLHRAVGYRSPTEFLSLASDALNPERQYYAILKNYKPGKLDKLELKGLARAFKNSGGDLGTRLAVEYLSSIQQSELSSDDNILLMCEFGNSASIKQIADKYLSTVTPNMYLNTNNYNLIRTFSEVPSVRDRVLMYLRLLDKNELSKQLPLLSIFKTDPVAKDIANKYISSLKKDEIYRQETISFLQEFTLSSKDIGFKIFRENPATINKVMNSKDYAIITIRNVIVKEQYEPAVKAALEKRQDNVPWDSLSKQVKGKYGSLIARKIDLQVKSSLYRQLAENTNHYWKEYIKYNLERLESDYDTTHPQIQFLDALQVNNFVFNAIFYHSNDTQQMKSALRLMEGVLRRNSKDANNIDTYANVLYKLGRKKEAIQWQKEAVDLASSDQQQQYLVPSLRTNLSKMERGLSTWIKEQ
jgi:hypothetical protein